MAGFAGEDASAPRAAANKVQHLTKTVKRARLYREQARCGKKELNLNLTLNAALNFSMSHRHASEFARKFARALLAAVALCGGVTHSNAQGKVFRFDSSPNLPNAGQSFSVPQYLEAEMLFRPVNFPMPGSGFGRTRGGGQLAKAPDNGTAYLDAALGDSLVISRFDGSLFDLLSVDLAEYSTVYPIPWTVPFVGYRSDGSTVTISFTTDGIIDGSGPLEDFETFKFDSEWTGLVRVEITAFGWSLDNLVVVIPEPASGTLLIAGALTCWWWHRGRASMKTEKANQELYEQVSVSDT